MNSKSISINGRIVVLTLLSILGACTISAVRSNQTSTLKTEINHLQPANACTGILTPGESC